MTDNKNPLKEYIKKNDTVIIGVSGGPDSVYLLLQTLQQTKNVIIAHINHQTRGRESNKDATFVESLARQHQLPFELKNLTKIFEGNAEDHFRTERYRFFEQIRKKHKADWILTAHHLNDNIETVLFNFTKGSFLDGLSGMDILDAKRHLLRPLLFTSKEEILAHLKKTHTPYRKDKTNKDIRYARNRMRHKVIPQLKTINPSLEQTFAQNIHHFQELRDYIEQISLSWIQKNYQNHSFKSKDFKILHPIIQKSVLFQIYTYLYGEGKKLKSAHIQQLLKVIHGDASNRKKEFGRNYFLDISKKNNERVIRITEKA